MLHFFFGTPWGILFYVLSVFYNFLFSRSVIRLQNQKEIVSSSKWETAILLIFTFCPGLNLLFGAFSIVLFFLAAVFFIIMSLSIFGRSSKA